MKSLESIYNSILLENQNSNKIDIKLLKKYIYGIPGTYTINNDGSIDVDGSVNIGGRNLTKIPFKFRNVSGSFSCINHQLTSLEGAPNSVGGNFYCHRSPNLPYSELFKIVDNVKGDIYYSSGHTPEDKDKIRRDRDVKTVLKDDELGSLDV